MKRIANFELTIENLAFGGAGVGRLTMPDGKKMAVFVEGTVPGDKILARFGGKKRKYIVGYIVEFIEKSPSRIPPKCKHFCGQLPGTPRHSPGNLDHNPQTLLPGNEALPEPIPAAPPAGVAAPCSLLCGGCSLQFLNYEDQLKIKEQHVKDAIKRIGGFEEILVKPIIGCKDPWYYRNKMELSFTKMKSPEDNSPGNLENNSQTLLPGNDHHRAAPPAGVAAPAPSYHLSLGLHIRRRHHDVVELEECFLMEPFLGRYAAEVRTFFRDLDEKKELPPEMELKSLVVRSSKSTGEIMVNLIADNMPSAPSFLPRFTSLTTAFFRKENLNLSSLIFTNIANTKGKTKRTEEILLHGNPVITETMRRPDASELKFEISPQAFFQPNTAQAEILYAQALKSAALTGKETVYDLYCGAGTIGLFCAPNAKKIYGIELNAQAIENATANARGNNITNAEFICGDVAWEVENLKDRPDVIILDPPRGGLEPKALEQIANFKSPKIVYISCNPTTQARDLRLFHESGYTLVSVQPVDMFPQTYHIESVAEMVRT